MICDTKMRDCKLLEVITIAVSVFAGFFGTGVADSATGRKALSNSSDPHLTSPQCVRLCTTDSSLASRQMLPYLRLRRRKCCCSHAGKGGHHSFVRIDRKSTR